ncbi:MAG: hypothetical protein IT379_25465 [Deltaproteobacteria bacterium]|nr:hypothetical protein [Deltaproteobacteria bacterium]
MTQPGDDDPETARVRAAMHALRRHDEASAPPFAATLAAARRRAPTRRWAFFLAGGALGGAAGVTAAAAVALLALHRAEPPSMATDATQAAAPAAHVAPLALPRREPLRWLLSSAGRSVTASATYGAGTLPGASANTEGPTP